MPGIGPKPTQTATLMTATRRANSSTAVGGRAAQDGARRGEVPSREARLAKIVRLLKDVATTSSKHDSKSASRVMNLPAHSKYSTTAPTFRRRHGSPEFLYLSALEHEQRGIPHLERQLAETPALFAQAVGLVYKRNDEGRIRRNGRSKTRTPAPTSRPKPTACFTKLSGFPAPATTGRSTYPNSGHGSRTCGRFADLRARLAGDNSIGGLLSKSGRDQDGIWPIVAVRDALEEFGNHRIAEGMAVGRYNQRGPHWRDVGGKQERDLAAMYRGWSKQTAIDWPFTSRLLERIAKSYDSDAEWHDTEADLSQAIVVLTENGPAPVKRKLSASAAPEKLSVREQ